MNLLDFFPTDFRGLAVDVGANDGTFLSKTLPLEQAGWRVLCIEPNTHYEAALRGCRKNVMMVACAAENQDDQPFYLVESKANRYASFSALKLAPDAPAPAETVRVNVRTLDWCLSEAGLITGCHEFDIVDLVTMDAEGGDMDVLRGLSITTWSPRVIIVENWSGDGRFVEYLKPYGYSLAFRDDPNEVFRATDPIL